MKDSLKEQNMSLLYRAILTLKDETECAAFFEDLCTEAEVTAFAQRFAVAKLIAEGSKYEEIVQKTGASPATISRVKRYMKNYMHYDIFGRI